MNSDALFTVQDTTPICLTFLVKKAYPARKVIAKRVLPVMYRGNREKLVTKRSNLIEIKRA